jgi:hypothetical protein
MSGASAATVPHLRIKSATSFSSAHPIAGFRSDRSCGIPFALKRYGDWKSFEFRTIICIAIFEDHGNAVEVTILPSLFAVNVLMVG